MVHKLKILIVIALFFQTVYSQDIWITKKSVNGPPKAACIGFAVNDTGYIGMGIDAIEFKRSLFAYNYIVDDWDKMESIGGDAGAGLDRASAVVFVIGEKAYVGLGGGDNPFFGDFWQYDQTTDSWTQIADFGGTPRRQAVAFCIGDYGYAGTGLDQNGLTNDFWRYNPSTNTWVPTNTFPGSPRKQAVAFSMDNVAYLGMGDDGSFLNDFWEYSQVDGIWTKKADFPGTPRYGAVGFGVFPNAYIATGYDNTLSYKKDVWAFNYWSQTWVQKEDFPGPARSNAVAFVIGYKAYIGTGYNGIYLDDFYEFSPAVGVDENRYDKKMMAYPNPANNVFYIRSDIYSSKSEINIYDSNGTLVTSLFEIEKFEEGKLNFKIINSKASSGIYYYKIIDKEVNTYFGSVCIIK